MTKTTSITPTKTITLTDDLLAEYNALTTEEKRIKARKDELRDAILAQHQTYASAAYTVTVTTYTSTRLESLEAIRDKSQKLYDALFAAGAVKSVESQRIAVKALSGGQ